MLEKGFNIQTERLILRAHTIDDVERSYLMNSDPEVYKYVGFGIKVTRENVHKMINDFTLADYKKYGYGRFAVVLKETNEFIGFSGLKYIPELDEVELGYRFFSEYWGKGIATEAGKASIEFGKNNLNLKKIIGLVDPENIGSVRVLEKLGFKYEMDVMYYGEEHQKYALNIK